MLGVGRRQPNARRNPRQLRLLQVDSRSPACALRASSGARSGYRRLGIGDRSRCPGIRWRAHTTSRPSAPPTIIGWWNRYANLVDSTFAFRPHLLLLDPGVEQCAADGLDATCRHRASSTPAPRPVETAIAGPAPAANCTCAAPRGATCSWRCTARRLDRETEGVAETRMSNQRGSRSSLPPPNARWRRRRPRRRVRPPPDLWAPRSSPIPKRRYPDRAPELARRAQAGERESTCRSRSCRGLRHAFGCLRPTPSITRVRLSRAMCGCDGSALGQRQCSTCRMASLSAS